MPKAGSQWSEGVEAEFWKLEALPESGLPTEQGSERFRGNCMTMAVLHLPAQLQVLNVSYPPFGALFTFMKQTANEYRQQIFTIVEKIDAEKFKNC